jgi:hypothetical protein
MVPLMENWAKDEIENKMVIKSSFLILSEIFPNVQFI